MPEIMVRHLPFHDHFWPEEVGCVHVSCTLIAFFDLVFHVIVNSRNRVIPYQINKEFRVTSRILTKLGVFVVPVVLITHANF